MVLELVAGLGRTLFKLFQHPSLAIVKAAGLIMKSIIEEGDQDTATKMQELALCEGALPRHLHTALFTASVDNRLLTHRQLSRHLIALWITGNPTATALLHRILVCHWGLFKPHWYIDIHMYELARILSSRVLVKAQWIGMVWAEFVTTSITLVTVSINAWRFTMLQDNS